MTEPDRASTRDASAPGSVSAAALFGDRLALAERYAELLATVGVERGLIGPREAPRIWDRHLLNCAVLGELIPSGVYVVDVGSGAGLPGIVLAVARPDLRISLVESLARRTAFLSEVVEELGLSSVEVVRARAEECVNVLPPADVVTARAVAPLDRLAAWCLPLARPSGVMLAIKGSSATAEVAEHAHAVRRLGGGTPVVVQCGDRWLTEPTTVVEVRRSGAVGGSSGGGRPRGASGSRSQGRSEPRADSGGRHDARAQGRAEGRGSTKDRARGERGSSQARGGRGTQGARGAREARSGDGGDHPTT